jgi:hypothetical protein
VEPYGLFHTNQPLALHNIAISEDHFVIRHDSTKSDKEGEKTRNKATLWTRFYVLASFWVSCCLSLNQNTFRDNSERVFIRHGTRIGRAVHHAALSYNESILGYFADIHQDHVGT